MTCLSPRARPWLVVIKLSEKPARALLVALVGDARSFHEFREPLLEQLRAPGDQLVAGFGEPQLATIACAGDSGDIKPASPGQDAHHSASRRLRLAQPQREGALGLGPLRYREQREKP